MYPIFCAKIVNIYPQKPNIKKNTNFQIPKDNFVKENVVSLYKDKNVMQKKRMINILSAHDYNKITDSLKKNNRWSDSVNMVGFNKVGNKITDVSIRLFNPETAGVDVFKTNVDDFINMYSKITSNQMDLHPDKKVEYKKSFVDFMQYISKYKKNE